MMPVATRTLEAIATAMQSDQGARFRGLLRHLLPIADDAYREDSDPFRTHLGASVIGRKCDRELWYSFRWTTPAVFEGQLLRLFNRGHLEEARMVASLMMIGCTVYQRDANGKQFRIVGVKGGHYGGSLDGVVVGCPDIPNEPLLTEFKTYNEKQFAKLKDEGLLKAKWEHFVQMQQYMGEYQLRFGLYMATNKNTDELHGELLAYDHQNFLQYQRRAVEIIDAPLPPKRINESPGWYECKFCDQAPVCHGKEMPVRTCRSCVNAVPVNDGTWFCSLELMPLSAADQLRACDAYTMIPEIKKIKLHTK